MPDDLPEATLEEWKEAITWDDARFLEFVETHSVAAIWDQLEKTDLSVRDELDEP